MKIPEKVRIGSSTYSVIVSDKKLIMDGREVAGLLDPNYHTLQIDLTMQDQQGIEQTFLHEVVHAILKERKIEPKENVEFDFEDMVDNISLSLYELVLDNPEMFNDKEEHYIYLTKAQKDKLKNVINFKEEKKDV